MSWQDHLLKLPVVSDNKLGPKTISLPCVRLAYVPSLILRFRPHKDTPAFEIWKGYVHYVNQILLENRILEKLFIQEKSKEEALRQFEGILFTLAQVAEKVKCKNGKDLKQLLVRMNLIKMQDDDIEDYDAKFFNCTNRTVRVKATRLEELVDVVAQYKEKEGIEDYVPKKPKTKKKLRCKNTGAEFSSIAQAAIYGNTGSTSIRNYLKGLQAYAGKLEDGTRLTWEWVKVEEQ